MIYNALNDVSIGYASDIALHLAVVHCFGMYLAPCSKKNIQTTVSSIIMLHWIHQFLWCCAFEQQLNII
jgi:hypothetical protein